MSINDVRSLTQISGSVTMIDYVDNKTLIEKRLIKEFPYHDQRVYRGMVNNLVSRRAWLLSSKDFKHIVHLNLIDTAKLIWPEQHYDSQSSPTLLYQILQTFLEKRDEQIKSYRCSL